jgi:hypothetical protein
MPDKEDNTMQRRIITRRHMLGAGAVTLAGATVAAASPLPAWAKGQDEGLGRQGAINVRTFLTIVEHGLNHGDLTPVNTFVSPAMVDHQNYGPGYPPGRDGIKALVRSLRAAMPDLHTTIVEAKASGDRVFGRAVTQGTLTQPYLGVPPTFSPIGTPHPELAGILPGPNGTVGLDIMDEFRFEVLTEEQLESGRIPLIVEHWGVADQLILLAEMAAIKFVQFPVYTGPFPPV